MKIKLTKPYKSDSGDSEADEVNALECITTAVMRAGFRFTITDEIVMARVKTWCRLSDPEFDQISWEDYVMLVDKFISMLPKPAGDDSDPKADTTPALPPVTATSKTRSK